jgi:hypothetical protein
METERVKEEKDRIKFVVNFALSKADNFCGNIYVCFMCYFYTHFLGAGNILKIASCDSNLIVTSNLNDEIFKYSISNYKP